MGLRQAAVEALEREAAQVRVEHDAQRLVRGEPVRDPDSIVTMRVAADV